MGLSSIRLPQLDGLTAIRGLAAWWVVLYHFAPFTYAHLPMDVWLLTKKGFLAVDLFFILSGFVIFYTYGQTLLPTWRSLRSFIVKRLARVYPLHLLLLFGYLGFLAVFYVLKHKIVPGHSFSASHFMLQLGLLQAWGFDEGAALSWNYPAWSISAEFAAYLAFPLVLFFLKPQTWPAWALLAMIAALTMVLIGYYFQLGVCPSPAMPVDISPVLAPKICTLNREIDATAVVRCILQFIIGMALCILYLRSAARRSWLGPATLGAGLLILVAGAALRWSDVYFATAGWALLVFGIACEPWPVRRLLCNRPLIWLGDISYATYMCHALVRDVYKLLFVRATGDPMVPFYAPVWTLMLAITAILLLSWGLYRLFERPSQKWVTRIGLPAKPAA